MKKAYITILTILMMRLTACRSEEIPTSTTETVAVVETTEATESTTEPTTTQSTVVVPTEQTEPPSEPTQAPQEPPREIERETQETPPEQTDPPATTVSSVQTEPTAETNPPEKIDIQVLIDYGREYAATTYGYEVCIGLRDGYYPGNDRLIYTMEDGYEAVRASVDCTTRMLLSRPGVQIVTEINGVLCRARIDIAVEDFGNGAYRIWAYYG